MMVSIYTTIMFFANISLETVIHISFEATFCAIFLDQNVYNVA